MTLLTDYFSIISLVQKRLAEKYEKYPQMLNVPGKSIACKIDENYYLILYPSFIEYTCKMCGVLPKTLIEALIKTGNLIVDPITRDYVRLVEVRWREDMNPLRVRAGFVVSSFLDNSFRFYGQKIKQVLPVSSLKISSRSKSNIASLFTNKTPLNSRVFF